MFQIHCVMEEIYYYVMVNWRKLRKLSVRKMLWRKWLGVWYWDMEIVGGIWQGDILTPCLWWGSLMAGLDSMSSYTLQHSVKASLTSRLPASLPGLSHRQSVRVLCIESCHNLLACLRTCRERAAQSPSSGTPCCHDSVHSQTDASEDGWQTPVTMLDHLTCIVH